MLLIFQLINVVSLPFTKLGSVASVFFCFLVASFIEQFMRKNQCSVKNKGTYFTYIDICFGGNTN